MWERCLSVRVSIIPSVLLAIGINAPEVLSWLLQLSFPITKGNLIWAPRQRLEGGRFASQLRVHLRWPRRAVDDEDPLAPKYRGQTSLPPSDQLKGWSESNVPFPWLIFTEQGAGGRIYSASTLTRAAGGSEGSAVICFS